MEIKDSVIKERWNQYAAQPHQLVKHIEQALTHGYRVMGTHISQLGELSGIVPIKNGVLQGPLPEGFMDLSAFDNIYQMLDKARWVHMDVISKSRLEPRRRILKNNFSDGVFS